MLWTEKNTSDWILSEMNGSQDDVLEGEEDGPKKDKHDWGAADLEKVSRFQTNFLKI